jgi:hypothetical protein
MHTIRFRDMKWSIGSFQKTEGSRYLFIELFRTTKILYAMALVNYLNGGDGGVIDKEIFGSMETIIVEYRL